MLTLSVLTTAPACGLGSLLVFFDLLEVAAVVPLSLGVTALVSGSVVGVVLALVSFSIVPSAFVLPSALSLRTAIEPRAFGPLTTVLHA